MIIVRERLTLVFGLLLLSLVVGCGALTEPTLDATSEETLRTSLDNMVRGMSESEKQQFISDARSMLIHSGARGQQQVDALNGVETPVVELFKPLHGMTVSEIEAKVAERRGNFAQDFKEANERAEKAHAQAMEGLPDFVRRGVP